MKFRYHRFYAFSCVIVMISLLLAFPVSAASSLTFINYDDYAEYSFPDGGETVSVDCSFPAEWNYGRFMTTLSDGSSKSHYFRGPTFEFESTNFTSTLIACPFNHYLSTAYSVGDKFGSGYYLETDNIPINSTMNYSWTMTISSSLNPDSILNNGSYSCNFRTYYVDSTGLILYRQSVSVNHVMYDLFDGRYRLDYFVNFSLDQNAMSDPNVVAIVPAIVAHNMSFIEYGSSAYTVSGTFGSLTLNFSLVDAYYEAQQNEKMQQTLNRIESAMEEQNQILQDQNDKLDNIINGGSAGEDLMAGSDKLEDAGSDLGDDLGSIQDFEDQYMGQLDDNMDEVIAGADLTWIYPALSFVQRYLNKIVAGIPSKYLIVFTLPMFFGLFMYIVGHPVRAPRPDTSGDEVTRETFTETHILTGKNAGTVRSTRTVTTSREIGRVHNE